MKVMVVELSLVGFCFYFMGWTKRVVMYKFVVRDQPV